MTLLAQLGEGLPERYYLGLDIGYKEHVGVVISLETCVRGGERWKRARCEHFPSTQAGLDKFQPLMAVVFPELKIFFTRSVASLAPVRLVAAYPTPAELAAASAEDVQAVLWATGVYHHARRVGELQELALHSSGLLPDPGRAWRLEWLTGLLLSHLEAQAELSKQLKAQVIRHPDYVWIEPVPYAGSATLGVILAVTGEVSRFRNYRRSVAYTGYYAGLEKSQTIGRTRMSRRGNRDLKRAYFQIAAPLVWFDRGENPYQALFERKTAAGYPWYEAMPSVCAVLARHVYHCLKFKQPYDAKKAFGVVSPAAEQALLDLQADLDERFEVMEAHLIAEEG
jgi:hypothetical protein